METVITAMALAVLVPLLCGISMSGVLGANDFAGIRTWATKHNEDTWRAAHRAALRFSLSYCAVVVVAGVVVLIVQPVQVSLTSIGIVLMSLFMVASVVTAVLAHRAALNVIAAEQDSSKTQ